MIRFQRIWPGSIRFIIVNATIQNIHYSCSFLFSVFSFGILSLSSNKKSSFTSILNSSKWIGISECSGSSSFSLVIVFWSANKIETPLMLVVMNLIYSGYFKREWCISCTSSTLHTNKPNSILSKKKRFSSIEQIINISWFEFSTGQKPKNVCIPFLYQPLFDEKMLWFININDNEPRCMVYLNAS